MSVLSLGSVLSGLAGGLTGIIGSITSAIANYKLKKMQYEHEEKMIQLQMEAKKLGADIEIDKAVMEARKESYVSLNRNYFKSEYFEALPSWSRPIIAFGFALLDFIRGIVRPLLTFCLLGITFWIAYNTYNADPQSFISSAPVIVDTALYLCTTAISWWFADRPIRIFLEKHLNENIPKVKEK